MSDRNDEFEEQLRMQELYGDSKDEPTRDHETFRQAPADTPYEWDLAQKAWVPKITDDFLATYQANYGFSNNGTPSSTADVQGVNATTAEEALQRKIPEPSDPRKKGLEKRKGESGWFHIEEDRNTNVYVSGLPPDMTVDEFVQLMSKFGIIMRDPQTEEFKVKLYKDDQGNLKGDGLCCYLKRESVELALKLLDDVEIRGYQLHVEVAKFQLKGEYDALKKKKKCKDYKKKLSLQQKQLDWRPERRTGPSRMRHERVVIIKNMFHPTDFEDDPLVLNEIREDLRVECSKFGQIRKLLLFDRHPDGVASVSFRDPEEADACIQTFHGRWFGGRQITAEAWDGTTDYQVEETSREREERLKGWEAFLNSSEAHKGLQHANSVDGSEKAGPSRVRHLSEHTSTSKANVPEAAMETTFEDPIDEKKFEKAEDEGKLKEDAAGNNAKEGGPQNEAADGCLKRKQDPCPGGESGEDSAKNSLEEGNPKKKPKHDHGEKLPRGPREDDSEGDSQKHSKKQFQDGAEKEAEENSLVKKSSQGALSNPLKKQGGENVSDGSELGEDSSEKVLNEEASERELGKQPKVKEKEEETREKFFGEKKGKIHRDEQGEGGARGKFLKEPGKKEVKHVPEDKEDASSDKETDIL